MLMTVNPLADAERWADAQEHQSATAEALEIEAGQIIQAEVDAVKAADWSKDLISGPRLFSADELLFNAMECDDDLITAFAELLTSPAAKTVRDLMVSHHAKRYWRDIVGNKADHL